MMFVSQTLGASHSDTRQTVPQGVILHDSLISLIDSHPEQALELGFKILELPETELPDTITAHTTLHIGVLLQRSGYILQARSFFLEATELLEAAGLTPAAGYLHIDIGNIYFHQKQYDEALNKYQFAEKLFREEQRWTGVYTALNNQALVAMEREQYSSAESYFREALQLAEEHIDLNYLFAHSYQYLGTLHLARGEQDSAVTCFQKVLTVEVDEECRDVFGLSQQKIAEVHLQMGDKAAALQYFQAAEKVYIDNSNVFRLLNLYEKIITVYEQLAEHDSLATYIKRAWRIAEASENIEAQIHLQKKFIEYYRKTGEKDSVMLAQDVLTELHRERYQKESNIQLSRSNIQNMLNDYRYQLKTRALQLKQTRIIAISATVSGILLLLLIWALINRHHNQKRRQQERWRQQKEIHKRDMAILDNKLELQTLEIQMQNREVEMQQLRISQTERELVWKATQIQEQAAMFVQLQDALEALRPFARAEEQENLQDQIRKIDRLISNDGYWDDFEMQFVKIHPGFFERLLEIDSQLSPRELKICAYHRMKMETKEISALTSLSPRTIESNRYRLKQKLQIDKKISFQEFINAL